MYPPQTSFIPISVALTRFIEAGGGFFDKYPYWYFGSTSFNFLTGPVGPLLMTTLHEFFPTFNLFDVAFVVLLFSIVLGAVGWGLFAKHFTKSKKVAILTTFLYSIAPWHIVWSFAFGEVSVVLASALTPWVLLAFAKPMGPAALYPRPTSSLENNHTSTSSQVAVAGTRRESPSHVTHFRQLLPIILFALLLLTNVVAAIPTIIGLVILGIIGKDWIAGIKRVVKVVFFGWLLTLWWYHPLYWLSILGAPSFGGGSAASVLLKVIDLFKSAVPIVLAVLVVRFGISTKDKYLKFITLWISVFGFLTLIRFVSDPDFWLDWTAWIGEVEIGLALLLARPVRHFKKPFGQTLDKVRAKSLDLTYASTHQNLRGDSKQSSGFVSSYFSKWLPSRKFTIFSFSKKNILSYLPFTIYFFLGWFFALQNQSLWMPRTNIEDSVEFRISRALDEVVEDDETVFLSGTSAFWLNSLADIKQVRGGVDQASLDNNWRKGAWEIRQGASTSGTEKEIAVLDIDYLVIHTKDSQEFYHDFENYHKFEDSKMLKKIYEENGDIIYQVN